MSKLSDYPDWSASLDDEEWSFYDLGVWKLDDGYYLSTDSGCSCPIPWENHSPDNPEDFTGPLTYWQLEEESLSLAKASDEGRARYSPEKDEVVPYKYATPNVISMLVTIKMQEEA